jgi:hypothetical protein
MIKKIQYIAWTMIFYLTLYPFYFILSGLSLIGIYPEKWINLYYYSIAYLSNKRKKYKK